MKNVIYPAIFHPEDVGGFSITFPDLPECITQGDDMQDACNMAASALGFALKCREKEQQEIPVPSNPKTIKTTPAELVINIEFDEREYERSLQLDSVTRTISIPKWADDWIRENNLDLSLLLTRALLAER